MKKYFSARVIALCALMVALSVIIGWVCKTYLTFGAIRITFENLPVLLAGIAFGPAAGALVGAASDLVSAVASGYSVNPLITVGAACVGACAGLLANYVFKKRGFLSVFAIALIAHAVGSMLIKSVGLYLLGYAVPVLLLRIPLYLGIAAAESYIIYILLKNRQIASLLTEKRREK
ncbi:MAG: folate family ECF transporter S component [Clostridia bacterium]|nr:folate family ECF transporter S component [Clostridia bacterium]MBR5745810.1 folate family ECF transporter S component [Clostridia bacterium]